MIQRCDSRTSQLYFCEFCENDFCCECTIKEAHDYNINEMDMISCKQMHESIANDKEREVDENREDGKDMIMEMSEENHDHTDKEKVVEISNGYCECGSQTDGNNFQCKECKKYFCEICPAGPLKLDNQTNCLECIDIDNKIYASTPKKPGSESFN